MKKTYKMPIVNVIRFEAKNILAASSYVDGISRGDKNNITQEEATQRIAESKSSDYSW